MYVKLFGSILDSSIWSEDHATVRVWITMLAMADEDGVIQAAVPGLARRANVTLGEVEDALTKFSEPDQYSRSEEHDGRRIEKIAGGWQLLNYARYRELRTKQQVQTARRVARHRAKHSGDVGHGESEPEQPEQTGRDQQAPYNGNAGALHVTPVTTEAEAEAEVEAETEAEAEARRVTSLVRRNPTVASVEAALPEALAVVSSRHRLQKRIEAGVVITYAYWASVMGKDRERTRLSSERAAKIRARLQETGGDPGPLLYAIDGAYADDFLMNRSERSNRLTNDIQHIMGTRSKLEALAETRADYLNNVTHGVLREMGQDDG